MQQFFICGVGAAARKKLFRSDYSPSIINFEFSAYLHFFSTIFYYEYFNFSVYENYFQYKLRVQFFVQSLLSVLSENSTRNFSPRVFFQVRVRFQNVFKKSRSFKFYSSLFFEMLGITLTFSEINCEQ